MEEKVKNDILSIIKETATAIKKDDPTELKEVSNHTIHNASIFQDKDSIYMAIIVYSVAKLFERPRYREYKTWPIFYKTLTDNLKIAQDYLQKNDISGYEHAVQEIIEVIAKLEPKFRNYVKEVFTQAKISKASRLYEHGLSAGKTASLLGISEWELMEHVGKTGIADVKYGISKTISQRMKLTRELFK